MTTPPTEPQAPAGPAPTRLAGSTSVVAGATLASRVFGLVREQIFAALLGGSSGIFADAFVVAFRIPNLLRDFFAEGAFSAAFVPTFTEHLANRSREETWRLANLVFTTLAAAAGAIALAGMLGTHWVVGGIAPGFGELEGKTALTIQLTRIMFPFLPAIALAAAAMGILNSFGRFFVPAIAPALFNLVACAVGVVLWALGLPPREVVIGWSFGVLGGGVAQFLVQVPSLVLLGYRYRPAFDIRFRDPGLLRILKLMGPAAVGLAATQINIFANTIVASYCEQGSPAWLNYAFRLIYLPVGIFGVAVATVSTAGIAHRVARGDSDGMRETVASSLKLVSFLCIPSTIGLWVLGVPIVRLLFQHGRFTPYDTAHTAAALAIYSVGLFAYSAVKVIVPAFYALDRPRIPVIASFLAVGLNVTISLSTYRSIGYRGLALGTSAGAIVNLTVLLTMFQRMGGGVAGRGVPIQLVKVAAASVGMGVAAWAAWQGCDSWLGTRGLLAALADALVPVCSGIAAYAVLCRLLRVPELDAFVDRLSKKLGRKC